MNSLPQADLSSFPSQVFWTVVFFILTFALVSNFILPDIKMRRKSRFSAMKLIKDKIESAQVYLSELITDIDLMLANQKSAKQAMTREIEDESTTMWQMTKNKADMRLSKLQEEGEARFSSYKDGIDGFMREKKADITGRILKKLGGK